MYFFKKNYTLYGGAMCFEEFSILELEKRLEGIELLEAKIEFISDEILKCEKVIQEMQFDMKAAIPIEIKFTIKKTGTDKKLTELLNKDAEIQHAIAKKIIKTCKEKLYERNIHFLDRAKLLREHFQLKFDLAIKSNGIHLESAGVQHLNRKNDKIIWMKGEEKLLALFNALYKNEIIPEYSKEEILSHFSNDKLIPFYACDKNIERFCWKDSDCRFAVLIDELAKQGIINDENKFKMFATHFVNNRNKEFKGLAQKRSYTDNYTKTGNLIREILNQVGLIS